MFCHSPADNWVSCLYWQEREMKHLVWTCYKDFTHLNLNWKWRTFFLATVLRTSLCSLILFDRPSFDLDKKGVREPPGGSLWVWRHFRILFALLATKEDLLDRCIKKGLLFWPEMLHATFLVVVDWCTSSLHRSFFPSRSGLLVVLGTQVLKCALV